MRRWWLHLALAAVGLGVAAGIVAMVPVPAAGLVIAMGVLALFSAFMAGVRYCERVEELGVVGRWTRVTAAEVAER